MTINISSQLSVPELNSIHHRRSNSPNGKLPHVSTVLNEVKLKRHLGLLSGVCFIIGSIVGSGIFISPKGVLKNTESIGLCLIVWMVSGFISLIGAFCYAEIGTLIPRSGAELTYLKEGIGSVHKQTGDILAFIYSLSTAFLIRPAYIAVLALVFSQYFLSGLMDDCGPPEILVKMTAIFALFMLMNINCISVTAANRFNIALVISKIITVSIIIIAGFIRIGQGHTQNFHNSFAGTTKSPLGIALAFYSGLFAYGGWNSLNSITEELKNPRRNLWLSIVLALPLVMILYIFTNISYFTVLNKAELLSSKTVAVTWGEVVLGPVVRALPILISISALGTANGSLFQGARYCMVGAQCGYLPEFFGFIQEKRLTPLPSIIFQSILAIIFCIPSSIEVLIDFCSFSSWIFYGFTFVATLCCKFTKKDSERVINVPIPLIILIILISIYLVVTPAICNFKIGYTFPVITVLLGLLFYYPFVQRKVQLSCTKKICMTFQLFFALKKSTVDILDVQ